MQLNGFNLERAYWKLLLWLPSLRLGTCWGRSDRPFQVQDAIMKHNIARGPNTMEFLILLLLLLLLSQVYIALITHRSKRFRFISLEIYNKI